MLTLKLFYEENPKVLCRTDDSTETEFVQHNYIYWKHTRKSSASIPVHGFKMI